MFNYKTKFIFILVLFYFLKILTFFNKSDVSNQNIISCGCKSLYNIVNCKNSILNTCSKQYVTLTDMYNEWGSILNWALPVSSACNGNWTGISCNTENDVVVIDLYSKKLTGTIPNSIGNLNSLTQLNLYNNQLNGTIPNSIGNLSSLIKLNLYYNQLNGIIPNSIGNLSLLTELNLYNNQLNGTIPSTIGNLGSLTELNLYYNQLNGTIPNSIGNLNLLTQLNLYNNQLNGTIPNSIGNLGSLTELNLQKNQLLLCSNLNLKFNNQILYWYVL